MCSISTCGSCSDEYFGLEYDVLHVPCLPSHRFNSNYKAVDWTCSLISYKSIGAEGSLILGMSNGWPPLIQVLHHSFERLLVLAGGTWNKYARSCDASSSFLYRFYNRCVDIKSSKCCNRIQNPTYFSNCSCAMCWAQVEGFWMLLCDSKGPCWRPWESEGAPTIYI